MLQSNSTYGAKMHNSRFPTVAALDTRSAAHYIGSTPNMLRLSRHTGELYKGIPCPRFMKQGAAVRYLKTDLDEWLAQFQRFQSNAEVTRVNTGSGK